MDQDSRQTEHRAGALRHGAERNGLRAKALPVLVAAVLLSAAQLLARWGPLDSDVSIEDIESTSAVAILIVAGATPWLLQWGAAALLVAVVLRRYLNGNWAPFLLALACTFATGLFFWSAWGAILWGTDPQEAVLEVTARSVAIKMGGGALTESMLYRVVGPVVCPLTLSGPLVMQGWSFLWAGLSSFLVIFYWTLGGAWCGVTSRWRLPAFREMAWVFLVVVGYSVPAWLRLALCAAERV